MDQIVRGKQVMERSVFALTISVGQTSAMDIPFPIIINMDLLWHQHWTDNSAEALPGPALLLQLAGIASKPEYYIFQFCLQAIC